MEIYLKIGFSTKYQASLPEKGGSCATSHVTFEKVTRGWPRSLGGAEISRLHNDAYVKPKP
jgi:hypothetical protein